MKKTVFIAAAFCVTFLTASRGYAVKAQLGLRGGLTVSDVWGQDIRNNHDILFGITGGVVVPLRIKPWFYLEPEVNYIMKGTSFDSTSSTYDDLVFDSRQRLHYLQVPLLAKFVLPQADIIQPFLYLAPAINVMVSAYLTGHTADNEWKIDNDDPSYNKPVTRFEPSAIGGAGVHIFTENGHFILDARIDFSPLPFHEKEINEANMAVALSLGYAWTLEREKSLW